MLPILFSWGGQSVFAYPLFIGLAWGLGYRLCQARLPSDIPVARFRAWYVGVFLVSWAGSKILYVATQDQWTPELLLGASAFWLGGGFVFLGGFLAAAMLALVWGIWDPKLHWRRTSFTLVPLLWAHALGRIGCFLAGCCFGTSSDVPWALHMHGALRHPVQLYEAAGLAMLAFGLNRIPKVRLLGAYLMGYGLLRWSLEWWRGDEIRGMWAGMSFSQWVALAMLAVSLPVIIATWRIRPLPQN
jgi:phosphatidylglycerol:prolipoprotein diacylglycerol transferase